MSDIDPDKLRRLLMEAYIRQVQQLQKDLEIRIASVLKVNTDLPARVGVNMAESVSQQLALMVEGVTMIEADKIIRKAI